MQDVFDEVVRILMHAALIISSKAVMPFMNGCAALDEMVSQLVADGCNLAASTESVAPVRAHLRDAAKGPLEHIWSETATGFSACLLELDELLGNSLATIKTLLTKLSEVRSLNTDLLATYRSAVFPTLDSIAKQVQISKVQRAQSR